MKNLIYFITICIGIAFCSCNDNKKSQIEDLIPADAEIVAICSDLKSLNEKVNIDINKYPKLAEDKNISYAWKILVEPILKNPDSTGINSDEKLYAYKEKNKDDGYIIISLKDENKFEKFVTDLKYFGDAKVEKKGDYKSIGNRIFWNSKYLLWSFSQLDENANVENILNPKTTDKKFKDIPCGKEFLEKQLKYDYSMFVDNELLSNISQIGMLKIFAKDLVNNLEKAKSGIFFKFDNGSINIDYQNLFNSKEDENSYKSTFDKLIKPISGEQAKYIPENSIGSIAFALKGDGLKDFIISQFGKSGLSMISGDVDILSLISNLEGDAIFTLNVLEESKNREIVPHGSIILGIKDKNIIIKNIKNISGIHKVSDKEYNLDPIFGISFKILISDNNVIISSCGAFCNNIMSNKSTNNNVVNNAKNKIFYFDLNMNSLFENLKDLKSVKDIIIPEEFLDFNTTLKNIEISADDLSHSNTKINFVDKDKNSLSLLLEEILKKINETYDN